MWIIVGLGNPGPKYFGTRHNLGFRVIEALFRRLAAPSPSRRGSALVSAACYAGSEILLAQPLTYMNLSGRAVAEIIRAEGADLSNLLIVYDDLDLAPGQIRLKPGGGSGGHRGLQSIIDFLDSKDFPRLRLGIGRPPMKRVTADYVLEPLKGRELEIYELAAEQAVDATLTYVSFGIQEAMNRHNATAL